MPATDPFLSAPDDAEVRIRFFTGTRDRLVIVPTVAAARRRLPRILGIAGIRELRTVAVWEDERGLCQLRARSGQGTSSRRASPARPIRLSAKRPPSNGTDETPRPASERAICCAAVTCIGRSSGGRITVTALSCPGIPHANPTPVPYPDRTPVQQSPSRPRCWDAVIP